MISEEVIYKGRRIVIYMHDLPNKQWMAEISINGDAKPIDRFSAESEDFIRNSALRAAKAMIDAEG